MTEDDIEAIEKEMLEELKSPHGRGILVCPVCGSYPFIVQKLNVISGGQICNSE
jgi:hypothetical protein